MSAASKLPPAGANYNTGNDRFNAEAAAWDSNPFVNDASQKASEAILKRFPELQQTKDSSNGYNVLEIGCGTGLLTLLLAPYTRQYVAVDAAEGMINVLKEKVADGKRSSNILPVAALLEDPEDARLPPSDPNNTQSERQKFDLITSHLVLHHIPSLKPILTTMLGCLKPGTGRVALTDFEDTGPEAKRFHSKSKMEGVERHGIPRTWMKDLMEEVGFVDVKVEEGWRMEKRVERFEGEYGDAKKPSEGQGEIAVFPFLLCEGRRP